jgi:hypothetical protein
MGSHQMTSDEMKMNWHDMERNQKASKMSLQTNHAVNTTASWSNREEEYYFSNKRLLFTTKSDEISDQWMAKLNALLTPE